MIQHIDIAFLRCCDGDNDNPIHQVSITGLGISKHIELDNLRNDQSDLESA
jgi:hypothetical protein